MTLISLKCFENCLLILAEYNICFFLFRSHTATVSASTLKSKEGFLQVPLCWDGDSDSDSAPHKEFYSQL